MAGLIGNGKRINVTVAATITKDTTCPLDSIAGVYMKSGVSGDVIPVALEGVFKIATATAAAATKVFAVGDKVYAVSSGGALTNSASSSVPLGISTGAATTSAAGAQQVYVKLCSF